MKKDTILLGVAAAAFLGPFGQTVYTPSLMEIGSTFAVDSLMVNLTISMFTAILAVSSFLIGPIADCKGRRAVLLPGLAAFVAGSLVCLFAPNYWTLLAGRVIQACGIGTGSVAAAAVIGDLYPPAQRAHAMARFQLVVFLGPVFGPVVGGLVAGYLHWQAAFAVLVLAGLAVGLLNAAILPETLVKPDGGGLSLAGFGRVFGNRRARAILLLGFSQFYGYYIFLVFLPALLGAHFTFSVSQKGLAFIPLTAGILVGLSMTKRWLGHWPGTRILVLASFAIALDVIGLWALLITDSLSVVALGGVLLLYGILLGSSLPSQSAILVTLFSAERATAMGLYNFVRFMGAAAGPLVGAMIAAQTGETGLFLATGALLLAAACVLRAGIHDPAPPSLSSAGV